MRRLKGALIGFGFIAEKGHLPAYAAGGLEIVAVADINAERRRAAAAALPHARIYETHEELLSRENDLEFVDIATPPYAHARIALAAFERGLHVLCEKPMAMTIEEARMMVDTAIRKKRVVLP
jgi:predicted dehydrogenase